MKEKLEKQREALEKEIEERSEQIMKAENVLRQMKDILLIAQGRLFEIKSLLEEDE